MRRIGLIFLGLLVLTSYGLPVGAASQKAVALRQANGLTEFKPPEKFLAGNFVADEMNPAFIFGPVQAFAKSRQCPTAWLHRDPSGKQSSPEKYGEYTVYLEEDGPDKVVVLRLRGPERPDSAAMVRMAAKIPHEQGSGPVRRGPDRNWNRPARRAAVLRRNCDLLQKNGELLTAKSPEAVLRDDLKFAPLYDLNLQKKLSREK